MTSTKPRLGPIKTRMIADAKALGYDVTVEPCGHIEIVKRIRGKTYGLVIFADGTAFDLSVDFRFAKGIRSYKVMRTILGL